MTDKVNEDEPPNGDESQMAKASGLNNSVLGGFARTTAKRFAEYKSSAKDNEGRNGPVATAPSNRHSRHDWLERLFDLFGQYAIEVNKLVEDEHLVTTCHRPSEEPSDNPLISPLQGCVSTKYWQLTVRLQADGIAGFLLPMSMEKTFLRDESLFERIFLIESPGDENAAVWSFDNKPTEFFQLPDLAKRFFGSLIEIARMEDISDFDAVQEQTEEQYAATNAPPVIPDLPPLPAFEVEDTSGDEAKFKDLLTHASNVASNAVSDATALEPVAHDANEFEQLPESGLDLMKLEAQAESVRKTNQAKSGASDLATKTLDSYALLDFEDAETYYSEYRLTPAPEAPVTQPVESLFTRASIPPPDIELDSTFESAAALAAQELATAEAQRMAAEKVALMAAAALVEAEIAEAAAAEEAAARQKEAERVWAEEESRAEVVRALQARAEEEARAEAERAEAERAEEEARAEAERAEEEARAEAERAEAERAEEEARAEAERAEAERAEEEARAEAERAEAERAEEEARIEAERAEAERAEEEARIEAERAEAERAEEEARAEAERVAQVRAEEEARAEAERAEAERAEEEARAEAERAAQVRAEEEAIEAERAEHARAEETARAEAQRAEAERAEEEARAEAERVEREQIQEEAKAEAERVERARAEAEAVAAEAQEALQETASMAQGEAVVDPSTYADAETINSPVSWESTPVTWEQEEVPAQFVAEHSLESLAEVHAAKNNAALDNQPFPLSTQSAFQEEGAVPGAAVGPITVEEQSWSTEPVIPTPVITRVTMPVTAEFAPDMVPPSHDSEPVFPRAEDAHAYRRDDSFDLLTPSDVDMSAPILDAEPGDNEIADALHAVTEVGAPPVQESLNRRELSSEVQKLAAKLQQTSSDLIDTFSRKAKELSLHAGAGPSTPEDQKPIITPVSTPTDEPVDSDGWRLFSPDQSALLAAANEPAATFTDIPEDSEFLLSGSEYEIQASEVSRVQGEHSLENIETKSLSDSSNEAYFAQLMSTEMAEAEELQSTFLQAEKFAKANTESAAEPPAVNFEHESARQVEYYQSEQNEASYTEPDAVTEVSSLSSEETPNAEIDVREAESVIEPTRLPEGDEQSPSVSDETVIEDVKPSEISEIVTEASVSEKSALLETFRRPGQQASKKFHPYSLSAEVAEPAQPESSKSAKKSSGDQTAAEKPKTFFESLQSIATRRKSSQSNQDKETASNPQEIIMPKTDEMSVVAAIEMMRHSVERELENVAEVGSRAFQDQDMDTVERAMKRTRRIREFKEQLLPALEAWNTLGREES